MQAVPEEILADLRRHGQEHVLTWWGEMVPSQRERLVQQLRRIDLAELTRLFGQRNERSALPAEDRISALPRPRADEAERRRYSERGEEALCRGEVAFLLVAGGQGTRLGFDHPKGMFAVGPVSHKSLFQLLAEKVLAACNRYGASLPFLVMTSPATDEETRRFFEEHGFFGLPRADVFFFCQGTMPALDLETGKLLLESKTELFLSPNGHGGTLTGLADSGLLDVLEERGVRTISYFQVDNPLVDVADCYFIGQHLAQGAQASSKVVIKDKPTDKLGNFVLVDGRCAIVEYSDLPEALASRTDADGRLFFWAGSPAIHLFDVGFLREVTKDAARIPWHLARKKVPHVGAGGKRIEPARENALKFERFIFDVLPQAERWTVVATSRKEFEPLKNASGPYSPATVRQALTEQAAEWLEFAGVKIPRDQSGRPKMDLEISPLFALDQEELAGKVDRAMRVDKALYLH